MSRAALVFFATLAVITGIVTIANAAPIKTAAFSPDMAVAPDPLKAITGRWYTQSHEGGVELYPCGKDVCGRFYWMGDEDEQDISRDDHNPDPDQRQKPLCRMQFMGGFTPDGQGHYKSGWIYSPRHGATFNGEMTLVDANTLALRGYLFFPFLGESQTWTRATSMPTCSMGN